jgi:hypothetical protein
MSNYQPHPGPPPYPQPGYQPNQVNPPRSSGGKGCLIAVIVLAVLVIAAGIAVMVGIAWLGNKASDAIGSIEPCPYVSPAEASEALGIDAEATLFSGGFGRLMNITDARVLVDKESCILQQRAGSSEQDSMPGLGRTVRYVGADATSLYDNELIKAKGITEDRGDGISVSTDPYFNKEVTGLGDRAFCTTSSGLLAGVLVHEGDTLVYVALTLAGLPPGVDLDDPANAKLTTDDPACEASQVLARTILAKG